MILAIFAKRRQTKEGKIFYNFLSTIVKRDGTEVPVRVKFRDAAGTPRPEACPLNIDIKKDDCNLATRRYIREDTGEECMSYTLWVNKWTEGPAYVDHSLDDFDM